MIDDQEVIKDIKSLGLNTYEVKIWTALLSRGVSTAGELSDIANVPRSRSYDVLESLEKKGFVVMKLGKPIKYLAVPPKDVLQTVKEQIEKDTEKHISKINNQGFTQIINSLQTIYDNASEGHSHIAAVVRGRKNIDKHMEYMLAQAKDAIIITQHTHYDKFKPLLNKLKDRHVQIKEVKAIKDARLRICIVDEHNSLLFPLDYDDVHPDYDLGIWIQNKETTSFLKNLLLSQ